jgi:hypothetical protein
MYYKSFKDDLKYVEEARHGGSHTYVIPATREVESGSSKPARQNVSKTPQSIS